MNFPSKSFDKETPPGGPSCSFGIQGLARPRGGAPDKAPPPPAPTPGLWDDRPHTLRPRELTDRTNIRGHIAQRNAVGVRFECGKPPRAGGLVNACGGGDKASRGLGTIRQPPSKPSLAPASSFSACREKSYSSLKREISRPQTHPLPTVLSSE